MVLGTKLISFLNFIVSFVREVKYKFIATYYSVNKVVFTTSHQNLHLYKLIFKWAWKEFNPLLGHWKKARSAIFGRSLSSSLFLATSSSSGLLHNRWCNILQTLWNFVKIKPLISQHKFYLIVPRTNIPRCNDTSR